MDLKRTLQLFLLIVGAPLLCWPASEASDPHAGTDTLEATIRSLDTKLFDAYNHCDLKTLGSMVSDDLEFYHDQTGRSIGKNPFLAAIKQNICGKVQRTIVAGSIEVCQLKGYGAVETGVHRFHHPGQPEDGQGEAKFVTVWQNSNGAWRVTRVISYSHQSVPK